MTTLRDRLADLADLAHDVPLAPPPPDLWRTGRRRGRRRLAAAAGAVVAVASTDTPPDGAVPGHDVDDRLALQQALAALAPRQRAVVVLRFYEDLTEVQTAAALGIAVGTVKSQARDALARLRTLLPGLDGDGDPLTAAAGAPPPP